MIRRPHLASRGAVAVDSDPQLVAAGPVIAAAPPLRVRMLRSVKVLATLTLLVGAVFAAVYVVVASTVLTPLPVGDNTVVVVRGAFPDGGVPADELVYVTAAPQPSGVGDKVAQVFTGLPGGMVVRVVAGPGQVVDVSSSGFVSVDGDVTSVPAGDVAVSRLGEEYLAQCVSGPCGSAGALVLIPVGNVVGQAKSMLTWIPPAVTDVGTAQWR